MTALDGFETRKTDTPAGRKFAEHERAAAELAYSILANLEKRRATFDATGRRNWGYVGDLGHVREQLQEVHDFLSGNNEE